MTTPTVPEPGPTFGPHRMESDSKGQFCFHCQAEWPCVAVEAYRTGCAELAAHHADAQDWMARRWQVEADLARMMPVVEAANAFVVAWRALDQFNGEDLERVATAAFNARANLCAAVDQMAWKPAGPGGRSCGEH